MKIQHLFYFILSLIFASSTNASSIIIKTEKATFKVYGNCGMCKETIESALKKNAHIKKASWNEETKMISVSYDPQMISLTEIHNIIASVGYDTEKVKGNDAAYKKLHSCCQYDRKKV
ncbi:MAG: heavy-metal-associated domain-containing protein [Opitutaceae bacterium]|nr:heavy-metal-associated domain-containing protein [Cytophagales bacterium]